MALIFFRIIEIAKSRCSGDAYPYKVGNLGVFQCQQLAIDRFRKRACHFRVDMQIEKSNYFSGAKKYLE